MGKKASPRRTLGFLLHNNSRMMRRCFVERLREAGLPLNRSQCSVLLHVAYDQGIGQAALAAQLDIEPIALVRLLDSLQESGLIERRPHATDRRAHTVWLLPDAAPVLRRIQAITEAVRREATARLSVEQVEDLISTLAVIQENLAPMAALS
jgi:MarR family transcriptional regulator, transcriptional regulator for hemolysin